MISYTGLHECINTIFINLLVLYILLSTSFLSSFYLYPFLFIQLLISLHVSFLSSNTSTSALPSIILLFTLPFFSSLHNHSSILFYSSHSIHHSTTTLDLLSPLTFPGPLICPLTHWSPCLSLSFFLSPFPLTTL